MADDDMDQEAAELWAWYDAGGEWIRVQVNAAGELIIT